MNTICIIQARMGSTRLPGKVMMDIIGKTMLQRTYERVSKARSIDSTIVATSTLAADDQLERYCNENAWPCFRGSAEDVLERYYSAAIAFKADVIVRITSDCPLIDPSVTDKVIQHFQKIDCDYASNGFPLRTFPRGLDTEVFSFRALERSWHEDTDLSTREHVTQYIQRNPRKFRLTGIMNPIDYSHLRWTVDEPRDLEFVRRVYSMMARDYFSWEDVVSLLKKSPELIDINKDVTQKALP
jgi:spore coat polysaccharide biosynthesis protein SpsF